MTDPQLIKNLETEFKESNLEKKIKKDIDDIQSQNQYLLSQKIRPTNDLQINSIPNWGNLGGKGGTGGSGGQGEDESIFMEDQSRAGGRLKSFLDGGLGGYRQSYVAGRGGKRGERREDGGEDGELGNVLVKGDHATAVKKSNSTLVMTGEKPKSSRSFHINLKRGIGNSLVVAAKLNLTNFEDKRNIDPQMRTRVIGDSLERQQKNFFTQKIGFFPRMPSQDESQTTVRDINEKSANAMLEARGQDPETGGMNKLQWFLAKNKSLESSGRKTGNYIRMDPGTQGQTATADKFIEKMKRNFPQAKPFTPNPGAEVIALKNQLVVKTGSYTSDHVFKNSMPRPESNVNKETRRLDKAKVKEAKLSREKLGEFCIMKPTKSLEVLTS